MEYKRANEIVWMGRRATELTKEELLDFVEQLNWLVAELVKQMRSKDGSQAI